MCRLIMHAMQSAVSGIPSSVRKSSGPSLYLYHRNITQSHLGLAHAAKIWMVILLLKR
jgi:hypothetical protein